MPLEVLAPIRRLRDAEVEAGVQRLADAEIENQRINSKSRR